MNKVNGIIICVIIIFLAGLYCIWNIHFSQDGEKVVVQKNNMVTAAYSLSEDIEVAIDSTGRCIPGGNEYTNLLVISDGYAYIREADCPDKICVNTKPICHIGEAVCCLPNGIIVSIE